MKSGTRAKSARSEKTLKAFLSESLKNGAFEVNLLQRRCFFMPFCIKMLLDVDILSIIAYNICKNEVIIWQL